MTVRAAGYVIVRKIQSTYEYLLLQASYPDYHWSPPKGHVDPGEDEAQTALREVEEESGYKKDDLILHNFEQVQKYVAHGNPKTVVFWLAELKDPGKDVTLSHEHKDYRWLPCTEACNLAKFQETKDLFEACEEFLKSISTN
ncbi:hypothetical protein V9T40_005291 [Parthenolecanium corni]|uniref:Bis(5'-nucleosyl)-tetraphosphatase [asymmetrical] n=1 Tax=Parthenolecanium corni TaxID=536013 RepID=A0AAN9Y441_9HEMI